MLRRSKTILFALALTALLTLPAAAEVREEFHKTVPMDTNGSLSVKNVNGSVTITAWDRNEAQIDVVKTAHSEEKLREARIEITGSGNSINVETKLPEHTNNSAKVNYDIHVPRGARIFHAETVNGSVRIDGPTGRIKAETVNGSVEVWGAADELSLETVNGEVKASLVNGGHRVKLETVNGAVSIQMPANINAHVKASTTTGKIHSDLPLAIDSSQYGPGANADSNLGAGGETISLETVNGSIYIHKQ